MNVSRYEKYWLLLLADGILTIQVPTELIAGIKKAIIKRKHNHRLRTNIKFNALKVTQQPATTKAGKPMPTHTRLTFNLHNLTTKDL